jgi:hypothetical protein
MAYINHYKWLDEHLGTFFSNLEIPTHLYSVQGAISCDGDKVEQYKDAWEDAGVPYVHGAAMYLLLKIPPYSNQVRNGSATGGKFVSPRDWVIDNYVHFKHLLPPA